ncbi:hypothetical protein Q8F55_005793 [Vanrija albida]|uniref:Alpha/beta hydrolase fold-3 domain-containing protein n=1 Tax=Vanrija albida TaxID=181172 RepID=A0ABR3Q3E6_9TREE
MPPAPALPSLRSAPDAGAPNGVPLRSLQLRAALALPAGLLSVPYHVVAYYACGRPARSLLAYLLARVVYTISCWTPVFRDPESWDEAASLSPPSIDPAAGRAYAGLEVAVVTVPEGTRPQEAYTLGPSGVEKAERPAFIITPPGARGRADSRAAPGEKLILYIHGGAYVMGHPLWTPFPATLARATALRVLGAQYRKAVSEATAFPAPLLDAAAAWEYATETLGFAARDIVLAGDSAGGHLALALLSHLGATGQAVPGGLALLSPWSDFTASFDSYAANEGSDFLVAAGLARAVRSATRHYTPESVAAQLFAPALAPEGAWRHLAGTRAFVWAGTREIFFGEVQALVKGLRRDGVSVEFVEDEDGVHNGAMLPPAFVGHEGAARFNAGVRDIVRDLYVANGEDVYLPYAVA